MRVGWILLVGGLAWTQTEVLDSLDRLPELDEHFNIVVGRTFPVVTVLTDTFPLSPLLSGSVRVGLSWRRGLEWKRDSKWQLVLSPLLLLEKATFRATGASVVPGVELVQQEKYFWFKYRSGALMLAGGIRFQRWKHPAAFPRWWVEMGCWGAYRFGRSMKYVAEREGRVERVRIEGNPHLAPAQGGGYIRIGRRWAFVEAYYHLLPYFRPGTYGDAPARSYPAMPKWEVGIGVTI